MKYNQLKIEEREQLAVFLGQGLSLREIGKVLKRSHSTISREIKRNSAELFYQPTKAEKKAQANKKRAGKRPRLKSDEIRRYVRHRLRLGWSPGQIAGRLKIEKINQSISHEAIYQYIYSEEPKYISCLARSHKIRKRRTQKSRIKKIKIPNRIGIEQLSAEANTRTEFGHWESDAIVSRKSKDTLNVLIERLSRYAVITKLGKNTANLTKRAINVNLENLPENAKKTITYDNGSENSQHEKINKALKTKSYFCNPYHSWEKGTVENTNGLIRRIIPKKTNLADISTNTIASIEYALNNRPKKCLNYKTPAEVFFKHCGALPD